MDMHVQTNNSAQALLCYLSDAWWGTSGSFKRGFVTARSHVLNQWTIHNTLLFLSFFIDSVFVCFLFLVKYFILDFNFLIFANFLYISFVL